MEEALLRDHGVLGWNTRTLHWFVCYIRSMNHQHGDVPHPLLEEEATTLNAQDAVVTRWERELEQPLPPFVRYSMRGGRMDLDVTWMLYDRQLGSTSPVGAEILRAHLVRRFLPNVHTFELVSKDSRLLGQDYTVENAVVLQEGVLEWCRQWANKSIPVSTSDSIASVCYEMVNQLREVTITHRGRPLQLYYWDTIAWDSFVDICRSVMTALLKPTPQQKGLAAILGAAHHARHTLRWKGPAQTPTMDIPSLHIMIMLCGCLNATCPVRMPVPRYAVAARNVTGLAMQRSTLPQ